MYTHAKRVPAGPWNAPIQLRKKTSVEWRSTGLPGVFGVTGTRTTPDSGPLAGLRTRSRAGGKNLRENRLGKPELGLRPILPRRYFKCDRTRDHETLYPLAILSRRRRSKVHEAGLEISSGTFNMHTLRFGKLALEGAIPIPTFAWGRLGLGSIDPMRPFVRGGAVATHMARIRHHTSYIIPRYPVSRAQDGRKA